MNNFEFWAPTKIIFGQNQIEKLNQLIARDARVLITYGQGSIKQNGVYDQVIKALAPRVLFEFKDIMPNPDYDHLTKAVSLIKENKIDFLLSVGGGSVIDATKFLAAAAYYEGDPWQLLTNHQIKISKALAHGAVLTLPATGTEMNSWTVISRRSIKEKREFSQPQLFLQFAILDPATTFSLPKKQITNGIVDAFVHVIEQYITYPIDAPLQDRQAEAVLVTLIEEGRRILKEPQNYNARANFMWAATMALNGLLEVGVVSDWTAHKIGQQLTALYGLDHGETLAIVLPAVFKVLFAQKQEKLAQYGRRVWQLKNTSEADLAHAAIKATEDFFVEVGMKIRLRDYGIGRNDFQLIADRIEADGFLPLSERKNVGKAEILKILDACY